MGYIRKRKNVLLHLNLNSGELTLVGGLDKPANPPLWEADSRSFLCLEAGETLDLIQYIPGKVSDGTAAILSVKNPGICPSSDRFVVQSALGGTAWLFAGAPGDMSARSHSTLFMIREGMDAPVDLLAAWEEAYSVNPAITTGAYYGKAGSAWQVSEDGNSVLFLSLEKGSVQLYRLDLREFIEVKSAPVPVTDPKVRQYFRCITPAYQGTLLAVWGNELHFPEVRMISLADRENEDDILRDAVGVIPACGQQFSNADPQFCECLLSDANSWLRSRQLAVPEEMTVKTIDGKASVQGWVLPPMNSCIGESSFSGKYPTLLFVHGGPALCYTTGLNYEFQALSAAGFGIVFANPRGSNGYGKAFADPEPAWDGTAMYDLLHFLDMAIARHDWIDEDRLGVCGGSYGGYMTIQMASHTSRFKAACAFRPLISFLIISASSHHAGQGSSRPDYVDYTDKMMADLERSPIYYADRINIPFQILQSMKDANCPPEQAHQLYVAIKDLHPDLPVQLVLYPDSNHGLLQNGPLYLAIHHCNANLEWFRKYLYPNK